MRFQICYPGRHGSLVENHCYCQLVLLIGMGSLSVFGRRNKNNYQSIGKTYESSVGAQGHPCSAPCSSLQFRLFQCTHLSTLPFFPLQHKTLHWFGSYLQFLKDVGLFHVFRCLVLGLSFYDSLLPLVYLTKLTLNVNVIKCNLFFHKAFPSLHYGIDNSLPCILLSSHQWHCIPFIVYRSVSPRER